MHSGPLELRLQESATTAMLETLRRANWPAPQALDTIVHHRGFDGSENNLLVIEVKRDADCCIRGQNRFQFGIKLSAEMHSYITARGFGTFSKSGARAMGLASVMHRTNTASST